MEADSADLVQFVLRDRGYTEVVLHTDDVSARYTNQSAVERHVTPRDYVGFRRRGPVGDVLFLARKLYQGSAFLMLAALGMLVFRRWRRDPWAGWDTTYLAVLALPLVWALAAQAFKPSRRYHRLIEAAAWCRWEEVLALLPAIRHRLPPEEAAFREAGALAGLGRLDEALALLEPFRDGRRMPAWLYWGRLPEVYRAAGQADQCLTAAETAAELAPENPTILLDLAANLLRYRRDTRRARDLLKRARGHALSDMVQLFVKRAEGVLALEEGRADEAARRLEEVQEGFRGFRHASPLIGVVVDSNHAYLALANAALGLTDAAERHFRLAEPRLRALKAEDLLERCRQALGRRPG
jgi:tetratricopeptide (TPR) repeat protein